MTFLMGQMFFCLFFAFLIGFLLGWLWQRIAQSKGETTATQPTSNHQTPVSHITSEANQLAEAKRALKLAQQSQTNLAERLSACEQKQQDLKSRLAKRKATDQASFGKEPDLPGVDPTFNWDAAYAVAIDRANRMQRKLQLANRQIAQLRQGETQDNSPIIP